MLKWNDSICCMLIDGRVGLGEIDVSFALKGILVPAPRRGVNPPVNGSKGNNQANRKGITSAFHIIRSR